MSNGTLAKVTAKTAAEVCKLFKLEDEAKKLLNDKFTPRQFLDSLLEKQQFLDAARFLAHALPKREAVWWASQCAKQAAGASPPPNIGAAIQAAEKWAADPSEDNRRKAHKAAEDAELGTAAGCAAIAAFFSGGSLGPPNVPAVPPADHLTAHAASCGVVLAAVSTEPAKAPEKYKKFFALGLEVAAGTNKWK